MKKILVTGGAGFIGSYIVDRLVEAGEEVYIYDNLDAQVHPGGEKPVYLNKEAVFIPGDVRDAEGLAKALRSVEQVYHLAAAVGVGQSMYQIAKYVSVNSGGTANLLDVLINRPNRVEKVVVAASMSSYGEGSYRCDKDGGQSPDLRPESQLQKGDWEMRCPVCGRAMRPGPTAEEKPLMCNSIYALTKKDQEEMALMWGKAYGVPTTALRFFNVYGPRQSLSNPYTGVCAIFMSRIKHNKPPVIYEDGGQTRDFISVKDIARSCIMAMEMKAADYEVFNVGTGKGVSVAEIAGILAKIYGKAIAPEITHTFRKGDVRHCIAAAGKIERVLGFKAEVDLDSGLRELAEWTEEASAADYFERAAAELESKGLLKAGNRE